MSTTITRSPSPTFTSSSSSPSSYSRRSYSSSPAASPAPFLTPNPFDNTSTFSRPLPRRLLSLQPTRPSPYPITSPISPLVSPISPISSATILNPTSSGIGNGNGKGRPGLGKSSGRPGISHRSHSFCASGNNSTYALASAPSKHLSPDKKILVAPPLERTISSLGSRGNCSPPTQQMQRPFKGSSDFDDYPNKIKGRTTPTRPRTPLGTIEGVLSEKDINQSTHNFTKQNNNQIPQSVIPTIFVHPSTTPPRPSLSTMRNPSNDSSRSSSYTIMTPTTPHDLLFGSIQEDEEDLESVKSVELAVSDLVIS
ncbi:uncharacterized protein IL334_007568 [Kwoniella shivajii]|uniref:Uncharacterized protein n=1 Tax=Kwoniella shivajii TaxID=564305 RepID=A0ABZ1D904_9TREE|nr:hypothetical protein IL334_007568 [Kwoniella shivajii]